MPIMPYEGQCLCRGCKVFVHSEPLLKVCPNMLPLFSRPIKILIGPGHMSLGAFICGVTALSDSVKTEGSVKLHARVNPSTGNTGKWRYPTALILGHVIP